MLVAVPGGAAVAMAVAVTVRLSDSSGASSPLCRDTSRRFLPCRFIPSVLFLPSPRLSLSVSQSISPVFVFLGFDRFSLYPVGFSLSVFPHFSTIFSPSFSSFRVAIYRGRGSGVDPAPSHHCPCMGRTSPALPRHWQRWPMEA
jgi:hypothetical protein